MCFPRIVEEFVVMVELFIGEGKGANKNHDIDKALSVLWGN